MQELDPQAGIAQRGHHLAQGPIPLVGRGRREEGRVGIIAHPVIVPDLPAEIIPHDPPGLGFARLIEHHVPEGVPVEDVEEAPISQQVPHRLGEALNIGDPAQHPGGGKDDLEFAINFVHHLHDVCFDELGVDPHLRCQLAGDLEGFGGTIFINCAYA